MRDAKRRAQDANAAGGAATAASLLWLAAAISACGAVTSLTRPEGDGGWDRARREAEIARRAAAAGVTYEGAAGPTAAAPAPAAPLDLPASLEMAASGNRRIADARERVLAAEDRFDDVRGRLLPATTATGQFTRYSSDQTTKVILPPGLLPPGTNVPNVEVRAIQAGVFNVTTRFPLDVTGEVRALVAAAQAGYRGEQARLWATTLEEELLVVQAYFQRLAAERLRGVTEQSVALYREQLANAEARYRNGRVTKNEMLIVEVALRDAEQELRQRQLAIEQARWSFNEVVGADVNAPTAVADVQDRPETPTVDDALRLAYEHNPLLSSLLEEQQRLDASIRSLERSRLPRFSAGGAFDYSTSDLFQPQQIGSGFAGFTWDLGTDTRREAEIAEARVTAEQNRIALERQLRELEGAIRSVHDAFEERLAALRTAEAAVNQAEENLRIRQQQFDVGRAQSDDVLRAQALLSQQRAVLATALYEAHTRRAELQRLIGLPIAGASEPSTVGHRSERSGNSGGEG